MPGGNFFMASIKNNGAIVNLWFSFICGQVWTNFGDKGEKFTGGYNWIHIPNYFWPNWSPIEEALLQNSNFNWQASDKCSKIMVRNSNLKSLRH